MDDVEQALVGTLKLCTAAAENAYASEREAVGSHKERFGRVAGMHTRNLVSLSEAIRLHRAGGRVMKVIYELVGFNKRTRSMMIDRIARHIDGNQVIDGEVVPVEPVRNWGMHERPPEAMDLVEKRP